MCGRTNIHPRKAFIEDLTCAIKRFRNQGHDVVLGGDFNESIKDQNAGILRLATNAELIDHFIFFFPHHEEFGTHEAGSRRIDYILMSPRILHSVKAVGYAPFYYATNSDHRPIIVDFNTKKLFGDAIDLMPPTPFRGVKSNDRQTTTKFIEVMHSSYNAKAPSQIKKL